MIIYVWRSVIGCVRGVRVMELMLLRLGLCSGCVVFICVGDYACLMCLFVL